jgi:hypothetical protein
MTSYTIAITPSDVAQVRAVFKVYVNSAERRVTDVSVFPGTGNTPLPEELITFDFRSILETIAMVSRGQLPNPLLSAEGEAGSPISSAKSRGRRSGAKRSQPTAPLLEGPRTQTQHESSSAVQVAVANRTSRGNAPSTKAKKPWEDTPSDLAVVYWREGTIAKVADHYSVPRHIAQRWIKLLRQRGTVPNPWPGEKSRSRPSSRTRKQ